MPESQTTRTGEGAQHRPPQAQPNREQPAQAAPQPRPISLEQLLAGTLQAKSLFENSEGNNISDNLIENAVRLYSGIASSAIVNLNPREFESGTPYVIRRNLKNGY